MDYRIFNMRTWSFLCMRTHTGVGHTDNESAPHFYSEKLSQIFLVLLTGFKPWVFGSRVWRFTNWATLSPHSYVFEDNLLLRRSHFNVPIYKLYLKGISLYIHFTLFSKPSTAHNQNLHCLIIPIIKIQTCCGIMIYFNDWSVQRLMDHLDSFHDDSLFPVCPVEKVSGPLLVCRPCWNYASQ